MFDLMSSVSTGGNSASQNDVKFGAASAPAADEAVERAREPALAGLRQLGPDRMMISAGVGYQFIGL